MARYKELEAPAYLLGKYANYDMALKRTKSEILAYIFTGERMAISDVLQEYYNMKIEETDRWLIARDDVGMREVRIERIVKNDQDNQTGQPGADNEKV